MNVTAKLNGVGQFTPQRHTEHLCNDIVGQQNSESAIGSDLLCFGRSHGFAGFKDGCTRILFLGVMRTTNQHAGKVLGLVLFVERHVRFISLDSPLS